LAANISTLEGTLHKLNRILQEAAETSSEIDMLSLYVKATADFILMAAFDYSIDLWEPGSEGEAVMHDID
jgi:hypothetical protein